MGIFDLLKIKKSSAPEGEIDEIERALERLRTERKGVEEIVEGHGQRRADMLMSDASDEQIVALDAGVEKARVRLERLELAELELQGRLAKARDASARNKMAGDRELAAKRITEAASRLDGVLGELTSALKGLEEAIPHGACRLYEFRIGHRPASPIEAARAIFAAALYGIHPQLFEETGRQSIGGTVSISIPLTRRRRNDGSLESEIPKSVVIESLSAMQAARAILVEPLRRSAEGIRSGAVPTDADIEPLRDPPHVEPEPFAYAVAYFTNKASFINQGRVRTVLDLGEQAVELPVAAAAIAAGVAVEPKSEAAAKHRNDLLEDPYRTRVRGEEIVDLKINLLEIQNAERERLNRPTCLAAE